MMRTPQACNGCVNIRCVNAGVLNDRRYRWRWIRWGDENAIQANRNKQFDGRRCSAGVFGTGNGVEPVLSVDCRGRGADSIYGAARVSCRPAVPFCSAAKHRGCVCVARLTQQPTFKNPVPRSTAPGTAVQCQPGRIAKGRQDRATTPPHPNAVGLGRRRAKKQHPQARRGFN